MNSHAWRQQQHHSHQKQCWTPKKNGQSVSAFKSRRPTVSQNWTGQPANQPNDDDADCDNWDWMVAYLLRVVPSLMGDSISNLFAFDRFLRLQSRSLTTLSTEPLNDCGTSPLLVAVVNQVPSHHGEHEEWNPLSKFMPRLILRGWHVIVY